MATDPGLRDIFDAFSNHSSIQPGGLQPGSTQPGMSRNSFVILCKEIGVGPPHGVVDVHVIQALHQKHKSPAEANLDFVQFSEALEEAKQLAGVFSVDMSLHKTNLDQLINAPHRTGGASTHLNPARSYSPNRLTSPGRASPRWHSPVKVETRDIPAATAATATAAASGSKLAMQADAARPRGSPPAMQPDSTRLRGSPPDNSGPVVLDTFAQLQLEPQGNNGDVLFPINSIAGAHAPNSLGRVDGTAHPNHANYQQNGRLTSVQKSGRGPKTLWVSESNAAGQLPAIACTSAHPTEGLREGVGGVADIDLAQRRDNLAKLKRANGAGATSHPPPASKSLDSHPTAGDPYKMPPWQSRTAWNNETRSSAPQSGSGVCPVSVSRNPHLRPKQTPAPTCVNPVIAHPQEMSMVKKLLELEARFAELEKGALERECKAVERERQAVERECQAVERERQAAATKTDQAELIRQLQERLDQTQSSHEGMVRDMQKLVDQVAHTSSETEALHDKVTAVASVSASAAASASVAAVQEGGYASAGSSPATPSQASDEGRVAKDMGSVGDAPGGGAKEVVVEAMVITNLQKALDRLDDVQLSGAATAVSVQDILTRVAAIESGSPMQSNRADRPASADRHSVSDRRGNDGGLARLSVMEGKISAIAEQVDNAEASAIAVSTGLLDLRNQVSKLVAGLNGEADQTIDRGSISMSGVRSISKSRARTARFNRAESLMAGIQKVQEKYQDSGAESGDKVLSRSRPSSSKLGHSSKNNSDINSSAAAAADSSDKQKPISVAPGGNRSQSTGRSISIEKEEESGLEQKRGLSEKKESKAGGGSDSEATHKMKGVSFSHGALKKESQFSAADKAVAAVDAAAALENKWSTIANPDGHSRTSSTTSNTGAPIIKKDVDGVTKSSGSEPKMARFKESMILRDEDSQKALNPGNGSGAELPEQVKSDEGVTADGGGTDGGANKEDGAERDASSSKDPIDKPTDKNKIRELQKVAYELTKRSSKVVERVFALDRQLNGRLDIHDKLLAKLSRQVDEVDRKLAIELGYA